MKTTVLFLLGLFIAIPLIGDDNFQKQPDKPVDLAHDKNLYVVGYAHLDTQWRWTYPYVIKNFIRNTMEQNFPLINKYPNYIFNFTGSRRYEFMKEYYPEDYEQVKKDVAAGRWFPAGSSVDENDANIPSLESFCRHFLYGNRFFQHEFHTQSDEYMLPDCFGFPASLPTVLAHGGIKGFSTQKLTWGSSVGIPFSVGTWYGPDGSYVVAALNPGTYTGSVDEDLSKSEEWSKRINDTGSKSGVYADYHYFGTGDRGGAPGESSVKEVERSLASDGPIRVISSKADQMFKDITPEMAAKLPTYTGELLLVNHSAGSLSSQAYMKRWNRKNEQLANAAESASVAAAWLHVFPYPSLALCNAWDLVLGSQMHDIMPGTSLPKAYEYSWNDEILALNQFAAITERASAAVLSTLDTTATGTPVAVYNPLPIAREDAVEADLPVAGTAPDAITAYDPQGRPVPTQILGREGNSIRVLFIAKVPSVGYAIYDLRAGANPAQTSSLTVSEKGLENARYRVTLDTNGDIGSIFDKTLNKELLSAPARLSIHTENPSAYPAWNMDWEDRQKPTRAYVGGPVKIRIVESGPARVALEVERTTETGIFRQQIRLAAGSGGERVEFLDHIDWRSLEASLRADFPLTASNPEASYEDKVGVVRRGNDKSTKFEMPFQQWFDLTNSDGSYGVTLMSDSKYGSDKPDDSTLRLTLLYTPGTRAGSRDQGTQDQGRHEILYGLAAHNGDWVGGNTPWQAARLNQPLRAFLAAPHPGSQGRRFSLLSLNSEQVQVAAVKKAEDTDDVIVRLKELTGKPAAGLLLRFPVAIVGAREVDAQERPIGSAKIQNGQLAVDMKPFSLRAFALKLAPSPVPAASVVSKPVTLDYDTDVISSRAKRDDGSMDASGGTYPAELFPSKLTREGVDFQLGSTADGDKNALSTGGQTLNLPAGLFNRVHLLVAADGDAKATIKIGATEKPFNVPNWTGYVGQWDNRLWDHPIQELDYDPGQKTVGLVPGYIKRTPVAWFVTHHNTPTEDAYYQYSYLFQLSYDLPVGVKTVTLPNDPKIRVFAVSVSREPSPTPAAAPLYDTLADHQGGGAPLIPQAGQTFHGPTQITLVPPLYHQPGDLRYTVDGTDPTATSPVYDAPFTAESTIKIAAVQIDPDGRAEPITRGVVEVHDDTPPKLVDLMADKDQNALDLSFSKRINPATASNLSNYSVQPALAIAKATPSEDGMGVTLALGAPMARGTAYVLSVSGLKDTAPSGNVIVATTAPFYAENVVYALGSAQLPTQGAKTPTVGLPLKQNDPWTVNVLVNPEVAPDDHTILAGFGDDSNNPNAGFGRYLAVFADGIRLWSSNRDVVTNSPIEVGRWQMLTATYDGKTMTVYKDGEPIGKKDEDLSTDPQSYVRVGMPDPWDNTHMFKGKLQAFTIRRGALSGDEVKQLFSETKPAS